VPCSLPCYP